MFTVQGGQLPGLSGGGRQPLGDVLPLPGEFLEFQLQIVAEIVQGPGRRAAGGVHPLREGDDNGVLPPGASGDLLVFQIGGVVGFNLAGNPGIRNAGIQGNETRLVAQGVQVFLQAVRQLHLRLELKDGIVQGLGRVEVCGDGRFRVCDDVVFDFDIIHFLVHFLQVRADLAALPPDEILRLHRLRAAFLRGVVIVNRDQLVQRVRGLVRIGGGQRHLQDAGFLGVRTRDRKIGKELVRSGVHGNAAHGDGGPGNGFRHVGGGVNRDGGEGEGNGGVELPFLLDGVAGGVMVRQRHGVFRLQRNVKGAEAVLRDVVKRHGDGAVLVQVYLAQVLLLPVGDVQRQVLHRVPHHCA